MFQDALAKKSATIDEIVSKAGRVRWRRTRKVYFHRLAEPWRSKLKNRLPP